MAENGISRRKFSYGTFWGGVLGEKDFSAAERIVQKMVEKLKSRM